MRKLIIMKLRKCTLLAALTVSCINIYFHDWRYLLDVSAIRNKDRDSHHSYLYSHQSACVSTYYTQACVFFCSNLQQFCLTSLLVRQMCCWILKLCCIYIYIYIYCIALLIYYLYAFYQKSSWTCTFLSAPTWSTVNEDITVIFDKDHTDTENSINASHLLLRLSVSRSK